MFNLARIDLNLLTAFEAILLERNVSRAAERVGLSQPTMSHALHRLRAQFGDELFRREKGQMTPTPFALELANYLAPALVQVRSAMQLEPTFDPATSSRRFLLGLSDSGSYMILRAFGSRLAKEAPNVGLDIVNMGTEDAVERIAADEAEFAVGDFQVDHVDVNSQLLFRTPCVVLADAANPRLQNGALDLDAFISLPHVVWTAQPAAQTKVDQALAAMGLRRRVAVAVPHYLAVPNAVIGTDRIAVFFYRQGSMELDYGFGVIKLDALSALKLHPMPPGLKVDQAEMYAIWHRRRNADQGLQWLKGLLVEGELLRSRIVPNVGLQPQAPQGVGA